MKKKKIIIIIIVIILVIAGIYVCNKYLLTPKGKTKSNSKTEEKLKKAKPKNKKIKNNYGNSEEVEVTYDQYLTASGYAGAADNVYYTKDGSLYHLRLSTNETIKIAEGVIKIESGIDTIKAYKGKNFKIIAEDEYIEYID